MLSFKWRRLGLTSCVAAASLAKGRICNLSLDVLLLELVKVRNNLLSLSFLRAFSFSRFVLLRVVCSSNSFFNSSYILITPSPSYIEGQPASFWNKWSLLAFSIRKNKLPSLQNASALLRSKSHCGEKLVFTLIFYLQISTIT